MNFRLLLMTTLAAFTFVIWGIGGRFVGAPSSWTLVLVGVGTVAALIGCSFSELAKSSTPGVLAALAVFVLGAANGWGMHWYGGLINNKAVPTSTVGAVMMTLGVLLVMLPPLILWALPHGEAPSQSKVIGIVFAVAAIYCIGRG